jgi:hypothetical protein
LWVLIVNNDDISFKNILPKLSLKMSDVKFLSDVSSESVD